MEQATAILNLIVMSIFFVAAILVLFMAIKTLIRGRRFEREMEEARAQAEESLRRLLNSKRDPECADCEFNEICTEPKPIRRKVGRPRKNK